MDDDKQYKKMSLIRKIIIITVIVLLFLWFIFFIRLSFRVEDDFDTNFDNNFKLMQEASKKYFTKDKIKEDKLISLKKMYELKLLDVLKTSHGEECVDIASFAQIIEMDDKYQLKITLVCGNNNITKTEEIDIS